MLSILHITRTEDCDTSIARDSLNSLVCVLNVSGKTGDLRKWETSREISFWEYKYKGNSIPKECYNPVLHEFLQLKTIGKEVTVSDYYILALKELAVHPWTFRVFNTTYISIEGCTMDHPVSIIVKPISTVVVLSTNDDSVYKHLDLSQLFCWELCILATLSFTLANKVIQAKTIEMYQPAFSDFRATAVKFVGCSLPITETLKLDFGLGFQYSQEFSGFEPHEDNSLNAPMLRVLDISGLCTKPRFIPRVVNSTKLKTVSLCVGLNRAWCTGRCILSDDFYTCHCTDFSESYSFLSQVRDLSIAENFSPLFYGPTKHLTNLAIIFRCKPRDPVPSWETLELPALKSLKVEVEPWNLEGIPLVSCQNEVEKLVIIIRNDYRDLSFSLIDSVDKMAVRYEHLKELEVHFADCLSVNRSGKIPTRQTVLKRASQLRRLVLKNVDMDFISEGDLIEFPELVTLQLFRNQYHSDREWFNYNVKSPKLEYLWIHAHGSYIRVVQKPPKEIFLCELVCRWAFPLLWRVNLLSEGCPQCSKQPTDETAWVAARRREREEAEKNREREEAEKNREKRRARVCTAIQWVCSTLGV